MKKVFLLIIMVITASIASCGGGGSHDPVFLPPGGGGNNSAEYDVIYNQTSVDEYVIEMTADNWQALQSNPFIYVSGTLKFKDETYYNVGIRYKGNSSYFAMPGPKKSFKIHFNEYVPGRYFHGLKKLNFNNGFNDPTLMREALAYKLMRDAGVPASRTSHIKLYVTVPGIHPREYFGAYTSVEQVNKSFLQDRLSNNGGNLFKAEAIGSDLTYLGPDKGPYVAKYELKTNELLNDYSGLINLCKVITDTPDPQFKAAIEAVFNVDGFLSWLAVNTILSYQDSYAGKAHNYYLYHNNDTGKFDYIPWDLNTAFGQSRFGKSADYMLALDIYQPTFGEYRILVDKFLNIPEYLASYKSKMQNILDNHFNSAAMDPAIDAKYNLIKDHVHADTKKMFDNAAFDTCVSQDLPNPPDPQRTLGLKSYVTDRGTNIQTQLDQ